jgi:hypothetical protein
MDIKCTTLTKSELSSINFKVHIAHGENIVFKGYDSRSETPLVPFLPVHMPIMTIKANMKDENHDRHNRTIYLDITFSIMGNTWHEVHDRVNSA